MTENQEKPEDQEGGGVKDEIIDLLATKPEARRDLIKWAKKEMGFNIEPVLEKYFGEMPDKKSRIEEVDTPMKDIAESIFVMLDEGYSQGQISHQLGLWPAQVSRIVKDRGSWDERLWKAATAGLPLHLRILAKVKRFLE